MIVLTVKTLDSQNHNFSVDDDITVEEFKVKIAETVNIPADSQRIIYCGRVLQDGVKLKDYDVNGKVVHLVQRPPPGIHPQPTRSDSPYPHQRRDARYEPGHTMYLGSMAFPSNLMESQGITPPPPTHSLAGSRLNVARRMLRRAEGVIRLLENPSAPPADVTSSEENREEEVTPIIEARVVVPRMNEWIDEAMVLSAVQNSFMNATGSVSNPTNDEPNAEAAANNIDSTASVFETNGSNSIPSEGASSPPLTGQTNSSTSAPENTNRSLVDSTSRTIEMAELLNTLNELQLRFAPFLERYRQFMIDDAVVPPEVLRETQLMLMRVTEVMHLFSHAYHSMSDIIVRARTQPPRALLCRPILIQHSAVVQAGIPIQVEAQINLEQPTMPNNTHQQQQQNNDSATNVPTTTVTTTENNANSTTTAAAVTTSPSITTTSPSVFQFMPSGSMRIHAFPWQNIFSSTGQRIETNNTSGPRVNNGANPAAAAAAAAAVAAAAAATGNAEAYPFGLGNNSSLEFFMEISPEGNISSRAAPELIQSIMNMADNIISRSVPTSTPATPTTTPITTTTSTSEPTTMSQGSQFQISDTLFLPNIDVQMQNMLRSNVTMNPIPTQPTSNQDEGNGASSAQTTNVRNSQARGNTQTNPTTATYTTSTPRPHVHLAQQAMQGGFDPFLPCNSHHISTLRRRFNQHILQQQQPQPQQHEQQQQQQNQQQSRNGQQSSRRNNTQGINSIMHSLINSLHYTNAPQESTTNNLNRNTDQLTTEPQIIPPPLAPLIRPLLTFQTLTIATVIAVYAVNTRDTTRENNTTSSTVTPPSNTTSSTTASSEPPSEENRSVLPSLEPIHDTLLLNNIDLWSHLLYGLTISQTLNRLPSYDEEAEPQYSLLNDFLMVVFANMNVNDFINIIEGNLERLEHVTGNIESFVTSSILHGPANSMNVCMGVDFVIHQMRKFFDTLNRLTPRKNIDLKKSIELLLRGLLPNILEHAATLSSNRSLRDLINKLINLTRLIFGLLLFACENRYDQVVDICATILSSFIHNEHVPNALQRWVLRTTTNNLRDYLENLNIPRRQFLQYIVYPNGTPATRTQGQQTTYAIEESMDWDDDDIINNSNRRTTASSVTTSTRTPLLVSLPRTTPRTTTTSTNTSINFTMPDLVGESTLSSMLEPDTWRSQVPDDWVPIITHDVQRQRRQNSQTPFTSFSDAYLSGLPTKRRKIVNSAKPQGSLPQVITDGVRRAISTNGLTGVASPEIVSQGAGNSSEIQTAYRNLLRTTISSRLRSNEDFTPERFPNAAKYFDTQQ